MARPPFSVMGRGEQLADQPFIGVGKRVADERLHLGGRGRESQQIQVEPADQSLPGGPGRGLKSPFFQGLQHERVDRVPDPVRDSRLGDRGIVDFLKRPVSVRFRLHAGAGILRGPRGSLIDPGAEPVDQVGAQGLSLKRHDHTAGPRNQIDQPAGRAVARDDGGARSAALEGRLPEIEAQAAGRLPGTVAMLASLAEDGLDVPLEIESFGGLAPAQPRHCHECEREQNQSPAPPLIHQHKSLNSMDLPRFYQIPLEPGRWRGDPCGQPLRAEPQGAAAGTEREPNHSRRP